MTRLPTPIETGYPRTTEAEPSSITSSPSEDTGSEMEPEPDGTERSGPEVVPDDADPLGDVREINSPCAQASLTQTAPDEESEAE